MANASAKENTVKTYLWDAGSLITQIDVRDQGKDGSVAYLYAGECNSEQLSQLQDLPQLFQKQGWATSSDTRDGKPVLRLTGLSDVQELVSLLENEQKDKSCNYLSGTAGITQSVTDKHEPKGWWENLRMHSLRASGLFYMLGNSFYMASGISRSAATGKKDWGQIMTGVAFSSGDVLLALFGGKDDPRQFKSLLNKLKSHWNKQDIEIPENAAILAETKPKNAFWDKSYDFMHEHINKIKALAEVAGGIAYFKAGKDQKRIEKQITAVIFSLGFGSTLLIPEKKPDPEKLKNAGFFEKAWAFVQEKPLRIAGWSGLSNTLLTTIGAFRERALKNGANHYKYDLAAAGSMFAGNNLYALSNKSTGGSITDDSLIKDIYGLSAQVLNRLPEDKREAGIKTTVNFLGERTEMKDTREEVDRLLREEMHRLNHENPWFKTVSADAATLPPASEPKWQSLANPPAKTERTWQEIVTSPNESAESNQLSPTTR